MYKNHYRAARGGAPSPFLPTTWRVEANSNILGTTALQIELQYYKTLVTRYKHSSVMF